MRAICGAIITAGALIGLGLTTLGVGLRYQHMDVLSREGGRLHYVRFSELDTATMVALVVLLLSVLIGMAVAFLGLAYHHERRLHERQHHLHMSGKSPIEP
jgi:putative Mn2+ efflux pump MntP